MMHKDFVLSQINKVKKEEDYTRVIKEGGEPLPPVLPTDPAPTSSKQGPPAKRPKKGRKTLKEKTQKQVEEKPEPDPLEHLAGVGQLQAEAYNMNDMKQVIELIEFLHMNGEWELFITPKDGQCLWAAFRRGMEVCEEYRSNHMRYQLALFCVQNHGFVFTALQTTLLSEYGHHRISKEEYLARKDSEDNPLTDQELEDYNKPGPFSFHTYLLAMIEGTTWGDSAMITLISQMWQVGISVVSAEKNIRTGKHTVTKIRHNKPLSDTNIVLVYAGNSHYLGACKYPLNNFIFCRFVRCCDGSSCAAMTDSGAVIAICCAAIAFVLRTSETLGP